MGNLSYFIINLGVYFLILTLYLRSVFYEN